jgi:uncharacterized protein (DUF305 family)
MNAHAHSGMHGSLNRLALTATLHCLTGCGIGEVLGLVIAGWLGWGTVASITLAVGLAFVFGYALAMRPLLASGLSLGQALRLALAADTVSIVVMETIDNAMMLAIPGAMDAHLTDPFFWGSLAASLGLAFLVTFPVNRWVISRGQGHALVHAFHAPAATRPARSTTMNMPKRLSIALVASAISAILLIGTVYAMTRNQPPSFDAQFIDMMVPHHQGAVEMAKIAQQRADHPEIAGMAEAIVAAQEDEIGQMKAWRLAWFGSDETPPLDQMPMVPGMGGHGGHGTMDMAADVEALRSAPEPFDKAFIEAMIPHHQSAIDAAKAAETRAERAEIKELAQAIIADQQREIEQMQQWLQAWYGTAPAHTGH